MVVSLLLVVGGVRDRRALRGRARRDRRAGACRGGDRWESRRGPSKRGCSPVVVGRVLPVVVTLVFVVGRVRSAVVARVIILVTVASDCSLVPSRLHVYLFRQKTRSQIPMTSQLSPGPGRSGLAECQYLKPSFAGSCVAPALDERARAWRKPGADTYLPDHRHINHRPVTAFLCYFTPFHAPTIRYE